VDRGELPPVLLFWREHLATALVWLGIVFIVLPMMALALVAAKRFTEFAISYPPLHLPSHIAISLLLAIPAGASLFAFGVSLHNHLLHPPSTSEEALQRLRRGTLWGSLCGITISLTLRAVGIGAEMLPLYALVVGSVLGLIAFAHPVDLHTSD